MRKADLVKQVLRHPPRIRDCCICGRKSIFVDIGGSPFIGLRCVRCRSSAIHRALFHTVQATFGARLERLRGACVYELSAHGAFYYGLERMSREAGFELWSSEFIDGGVPGDYYNGVRCEDIERLTFDDNTFDLVTSSEVMEHVEDLERAMSEIWRVLRPGGRYMFTVPIDMSREQTVLRAERAEDGSRVDLLPPEYHGDPMRGERGVFTWRTFGADLAELMADIGFEARLDPPSLPELSAELAAARPVAVLRKPAHDASLDTVSFVTDVSETETREAAD